MKLTEIEKKWLDNPPKCIICGKKMKPQFDSKLKRISGFIWHCECMPKDMDMMIA